MKKIITIILCSLLTIALSACSIRPHIAKNNLVEKVAKECINPDVRVVSKEHQIEDSGAGSYIWYQLEDERGINFRVGISNSYITIVEPIKPFYSSRYSYITDYKKKVIDYYKEDIIKLLNNDNVKKYDFNGGINIEFKSDVELSEIAEIIMKINDMLAFDYRYNGDSNGFIASDLNARWSGYCPGDILVIAKNDASNNSNYLFFASFIFSDNNLSDLTYDKVIRCLSADIFSRENYERDKNKIGMFMMDDVLYYDTGEVTDTVSEDDCGKTTERSVLQIPQNNGESNIGASMPYTMICDTELVVFYQDEGHIYRVFEY